MIEGGWVGTYLAGNAHHMSAILGVAGMRRVAAESSAYYLVGYDPAKEPDGKYRKIRVRVKRKDVRVRARKGYYADAAPPASH